MNRKLLKCVALDIDGVLLKGKTVIDGAPTAVQKLVTAKIPFVFVTNGGGILEEEKARSLSVKLGVTVQANQVIVCHTAMQSLVNKYRASRVLVLGNDRCLSIAKTYEFLNTVSVDQLHAEREYAYPHRYPSQHTKPAGKIDAAMIFHDPIDWGLDMQILSDVLLGDDHKSDDIPLFACNADLVYNTEYSFPRFTQGAFVESFRHLFRLYSGREPSITYFGKPYSSQYRWAENMLAIEANRLGYDESFVQELKAHASTDKVLSHRVNDSSEIICFGIGDNPKSDIRGANAAGSHWRSILVRTGLFKSSKVNDEDDPADVVCDDISAAIDFILSQELDQ